MHLRNLSCPGMVSSNLTATVAWYAQTGGPPNATLSDELDLLHRSRALLQ